MDIPSQPGDFKYESGSGQLPSPHLLITMVIHGPIDGKDHEGLFGVLQSLDALMVGDSAWIAKSDRTPQSVSDELRRHLIGDEYACVFTVCDHLSFAAPVFLKRFFESGGIRIEQASSIPPPVRRDFHRD
jgi:hypothetical protein